MYTLLLDISKQITADTGIVCNVYPDLKLANETQLIIQTKSLMKIERNGHQNNPALKDVANELHLDFILDGRGNKTRDLVEEFYQINDTLNSYLLRKREFTLGGVSGAGSMFKMNLKSTKVLNGGVYWENPEGSETDDIFILQERWECILRYFDYK